ncbi:MAG: DMT family transporter [Desulfovibrio sp.]|nr:DMT family transporter [Desulfovibrio sp.]MCA1986234.1 DMT family transporter [Desulfovibrio sp.]
MNASPASPSSFPPAAVAALCVALVFWSSAFVAIRAALPDFSPGHLACLRFLTASACLVPLVIVHRLRNGYFPPPRLRDLPGIFLHGFVGFFVYHLLLNEGEKTVTGASAAFLIGAIPVSSTLLAALFLKETLTCRAILGLVVSMVGVSVIALGEGGGMTFDRGAILVLVAAVAESVYFVAIKERLARYGSLAYTIYTMWAGTIFLCLRLPGLGEAVANASPQGFWSVIYLGVCPAALGYVLWNFALSKGQVGWISSTQFSQPFIAMAVGLIWLGELPGPVSIVGGLVAIAGAAITTGQVAMLARRWRKA